MQDEVKYRTSLVSKSLPIKKRIFAIYSNSATKAIQYAFRYEIDRWGFGVGTSVLLLPFLKAEGGYEYHYRNRGEDGWKSRHRYHAGVSFTLKKRQWTFTLRERFQHTFDGRGADEFRLRTRLKAAYKVTTWSPYVSLEQYHGLGKDEWFHASRFRARGGVEAKLSSSWSADVFYCYQHEGDLDRHILGWELIYRF